MCPCVGAMGQLSWAIGLWYGRGMVEVCEGAPVAVSGWVLTDRHDLPMQTTSCTWPYVVPIGEDPAAHGHWCAFTDLYHTIPYLAPCAANSLHRVMLAVTTSVSNVIGGTGTLGIA